MSRTRRKKNSDFSHFFFFFNDTATPDIYPLPLPAALPISQNAALAAASAREMGVAESAIARAVAAFEPLPHRLETVAIDALGRRYVNDSIATTPEAALRSEEHTSELQSQSNLVCRLLLEKK